jgi:hypothetical protein
MMPEKIERSCRTCRFGPECELGLERWRGVCDPGDFGVEPKDCWKAKKRKARGEVIPEKIAPCPWCGYPARADKGRNYHMVLCPQCLARGPTVDGTGDWARKRSISRWNRVARKVRGR